MSLKFGDQVKIISGFYEGAEGVVEELIDKFSIGTLYRVIGSKNCQFCYLEKSLCLKREFDANILDIHLEKIG